LRKVSINLQDKFDDEDSPLSNLSKPVKTLKFHKKVIGKRVLESSRLDNTKRKNKISRLKKMQSSQLLLDSPNTILGPVTEHGRECLGKS
jgi:hypothetical protein